MIEPEIVIMILPCTARDGWTGAAPVRFIYELPLLRWLNYADASVQKGRNTFMLQ